LTAFDFIERNGQPRDGGREYWMSHKPYVAVTHRITISVKEIEGICTAGLKVGDKIVIRVPRIDVRETDNLCMNALSALMPYLRQWSTEPYPPNARPFVSCPDPGPKKGGKGHVLFQITSERIKGKSGRKGSDASRSKVS
jgi:uncharacterized repeat protein (TIGR04076 family)